MSILFSRRDHTRCLRHEGKDRVLWLGSMRQKGKFSMRTKSLAIKKSHRRIVAIAAVAGLLALSLYASASVFAVSTSGLVTGAATEDAMPALEMLGISGVEESGQFVDVTNMPGSLLWANSPNPPPTASKTLPVTRIEQEETNWCWAASAEMIGKYVKPNSTVGQEAVVTDRVATIAGGILGPWSQLLFAMVDAPPYNIAGIAPWTAEGIELVSDGEVEASWGLTRSFEAHVSSIDEGKPLAAMFMWSWLPPSGHCLVVSGYQNANASFPELVLIDPVVGKGIAPYRYDLLAAGCTIQSGTGTYSFSAWID
jgi:hypothetical protein